MNFQEHLSAQYILVIMPSLDKLHISFLATLEGSPRGMADTQKSLGGPGRVSVGTGDRGERTVYPERELRLRPEVSGASGLSGEKEDNGRKPQSQIRGGGDRESLAAHLRVLCGCTVWGTAGEKSVREHGRPSDAKSRNAGTENNRA